MPILVQLALPITDPVFIFALVMVIILVAPLLFARLRIPGIVGLILAGLIVGPNATGLLERDQTIELLGTVGLLYIMFVAGLEINLAQFSKYRNRSIVFGSLTFFLPQVVGTLLAVYFFGFAWGAAVLLASMFASHTLLAYPIASRLGIAKSEPVTTTVGGTVITDTAALMVLVVIAGGVEGTLNTAFWVRLTLALGVFGILVFWALPRIGRWFFRRLQAESTAEFVFVLAAVFLSALISEFAGLEPIIGAFMAGLALNRLIPEQSILMNRIHFVGHALFIPFFLLSVGMLVDLDIFTGGVEAWAVAAFMAVTVIATKFLAAQLTRRIFHYSADEGMTVFGLSVAQAAATLAVVIVGYDLAVFDDLILNGTIFMILITCVMSPAVVERYGRRMALAEERKPYRPSEAPQRILVPLANPATAAALMDLALLIRRPAQDEPVYPLVVVRDGLQAEGDVAASEKLLGYAVAHGSAAEVPIHPLTRIDMNPADGMVRAIRERRISEIVIGWTPDVSASERIFGSVLDQLLSETREQVVVSKIDNPVNTLDRILLTIPPFADREPGFTFAVQDIKSLANQLGAELVVIATASSIPTFENTIAEMLPEIPVRFVRTESWSRLVAILEETVKPHDLIAILSARAGTISWRPTLDRLPRLIAHRLPLADFVIVYPSEVRTDVEGLPHGREEIWTDALNKRNVVISFDETNGDALVERILTTYFGERRGVIERIAKQLSDSSAEYRPEIQKGVVFYHALSEDVSDPKLLVGISPGGVNFRSTSSPVNVALLVLNPSDGKPPAHLRLLAMAARMVRDRDTLEKLRRATTSDEAMAVLRAAAAKPARRPIAKA